MPKCCCQTGVARRGTAKAFLSEAITVLRATSTHADATLKLGYIDQDGIDNIEVKPDGVSSLPILEEQIAQKKKKKIKGTKLPTGGKGIKGGKGTKGTTTPKPSTPSTCCGAISDDHLFDDFLSEVDIDDDLSGVVLIDPDRI